MTIGDCALGMKKPRPLQRSGLEVRVSLRACSFRAGFTGGQLDDLLRLRALAGRGGRILHAITLVQHLEFIGAAVVLDFA